MGGLVDSINAMQLAMQATVSQAFKTPEIIRLFAKKQPDVLRQRLDDIERDFKVGKLDDILFTQQKLEIIGALSKLGEGLSEAEKEFFENNSDKSQLIICKLSIFVTFRKMRFRFCGGEDCPDWLLAEIASLAAVSVVKVRQHNSGL